MIKSIKLTFMKKQNYFILVTEHHLIQFESAIRHFNLNEESVIVFVFKFPQNNDSYLWINDLKKKYIVFDYVQWSPKELITNRTEINRYIADLKRFSKNNNARLFTNSYYIDASQLANRILSPIDFFIMDEGNASFELAIRRSKKIGRFSFYHLIISIFYGVLIMFPKRVIYFTQYNLPIDNNMDGREIYCFDEIDNDIKMDNNSIIILGSSMYLGKYKLVSEQYYISILKKVISIFSEKKIYYYAHRSEPLNSLNKIEYLVSTIIDNKAPFEFVFSQLKDCPSIIISFASPILDTLSKKYKNVPRFIVLKPNINDYQTNKELYELIYRSYELNKKIEIWNIDEQNI